MSSQLFLLDQMFDRLVVRILREKNYDVISVSELGMATADDAEIMAWAIGNNRVLITLDEHFGDWAILPLSRHPGVIRLKVNPATATTTLTLLLPFLQCHAESDFGNRLVIVREQGTRWIKTAE